MNKLLNKTIQVDEIQPYRNVYKEDLVRIGVIDGNIFHSIMVAYSDRYLKSTLDKRIETVKMVRECIGNSITRKQWQTLQETSPGIIARQFLKVVQTVQSSNFDVIHSIDNKKLCKLLLELLISSRILNDITLNKPGIEQIVELISVTLKVMLRDMEPKRIDFFTENMIRFVNDMWIEARNHSYDEFKSAVKNYSEPIGEEIIPFISSVLNRDIYLFKDGKLKQSTEEYKHRKSIIIDQITDNQFAAVGKRLYSSDIEWSFEPDSNLINKINPKEREERSPMTVRRHFDFNSSRIRPTRRELPKLNADHDQKEKDEIEPKEDSDHEEEEPSDKEEEVQKDKEVESPKNEEKEKDVENENETEKDEN